MVKRAHKTCPSFSSHPFLTSERPTQRSLRGARDGDFEPTRVPGEDRQEGGRRQYAVPLRVIQYLFCYSNAWRMADEMSRAGDISCLEPIDGRSGAGDRAVRKRLDGDRRDELLDGVMAIIAERGFSQVAIAELARELKCSAATLYKVAPSKDSLVLLAFARWADVAFADLEACAAKGSTASERARAYFRAGAARIRPLSLAFYADVARFESTRLGWRTTVVDRYIGRFVELVAAAEAAGEIRPVNLRFLAELLQQMGQVTRDDRVLREAGLSSEAAVLLLDSLIWEGLLIKE
jgi:AcrR family transcriptional regulator